MNTLQLCDQHGYLGGAATWLPATDWDHDSGALHPRVACNHLHCSTCGESVQSQLGVTLDGLSQQSVSGVVAGVPLDQQLNVTTNAASRTYACNCTAYSVTGTEPLLRDEYDRHDPGLPWRCAGHPPLELPAHVDGVSLKRDGDWELQVQRALAGLAPAHWAPAGIALERHPATWLARIVTHLADRTLAAAIAAKVASHLTAPLPAVRRAAVNFYRHRPGDPGADQLAQALMQHGRLFVGVALPGNTARDLAYELRECIEVQLARAPQPALANAVKAELLAGRGTTGFVLWTGQQDPHWLAAHAATLVAQKAASAGRLRRMIAGAPASVQATMERALDTR